MKTVTNENGLSVEIIEGHPEEIEPNIFLGGDSNNPSWEEYLGDFKEEYKPHVLLIRDVIKENCLLGYTGQDAQDYYFKFSDGEFWGFSWRAWGDLMQAIVDKREGYMAYYM